MKKLACLGLVLAASFVFGGCIDEPERRIDFACADREVFVNFVSPMMERRCGTLDCHGHDQRPMRLFGELGLRHPQELNRTGGDSTTARELDANYRAVCSIEPEKTTNVALDPGGQSVNKLYLVRKARGQERHKGGKVFDPFDDADRCVVGWLRSDNPRAIREACQAALNKLPDTVELPEAPAP